MRTCHETEEYLRSKGYPEDEILDSRKSRVRYPENLHPGKPYEIYANGLEMKGQQLCDLLNQRLER